MIHPHPPLHYVTLRTVHDTPPLSIALRNTSVHDTLPPSIALRNTSVHDTPPPSIALRNTYVHDTHPPSIALCNTSVHDTPPPSIALCNTSVHDTPPPSIALRNTYVHDTHPPSIASCNTSVHDTPPPSIALHNTSVQFQALVTPLIKKKTLCRNEFKNYRQISNLSFLSQILEKIVAKHLNALIEEQLLSNHVQSPYKRFHSTEIALLKIHNDIMQRGQWQSYRSHTIRSVSCF